MEQQSTPAETAWETPQLIVLGRGRPEEHVLTKCTDSLPIGVGGTPLRDPNGS